MKHILVTGCAGFIGFHLCQRLLREGERVVGIDNLNDYYDVGLKKRRLGELLGKPGFTFELIDLADRAAMRSLFARSQFRVVVNLAAQAGVRYSLNNPSAYIDSNLVGFANVLEGCRHGQIEHLVFASSSSVYGANTKMPFSVHDNVDHPISLYAASKKANELMAHSYAHLFGLPCTGLRFFTVYGPWGRPDMALFKFTKCLMEGQRVDLYNHGNMRRDFTYIDDIVEGITLVMRTIPAGNPDWNGNNPDPGGSRAPYRVYNIGNSNPVELTRLISLLEETVGKKAQLNLLPLQPGDVLETYADVQDLETAVGFRPTTPIEKGVEEFVKWYRTYYDIPQQQALVSSQTDLNAAAW